MAGLQGCASYMGALFHLGAQAAKSGTPWISLGPNLHEVRKLMALKTA